MLNRKDPRLEFHCNAMVLGLDGIKTITDISLGGIFIEVEELDKIKIGQPVMINVKLPTEPKTMRFKAKAVIKNHRGIGFQFISLEERQKDAICLCFEYFKDTLPAKCK
ncbi:MAG: PilZ domain-containing protein [Nitrospinales bacterium]